MKSLFRSKFFLMSMGFVSGAVNGLLGAGGGIVTVYALSASLSGSQNDKRDVFANALCVMLPISAVSLIGYAVMGNVEFASLGAYALPAIVGGVLGGLLLGRINTVLLKKLFAAIVIYSGLTLMIK